MRGIPAGPATTAERPTSVVQRRGESAGLRSGPSADHARCPSGPGHLVVAGRAGHACPAECHVRMVDRSRSQPVTGPARGRAVRRPRRAGSRELRGHRERSASSFSLLPAATAMNLLAVVAVVDRAGRRSSGRPTTTSASSPFRVMPCARVLGHGRRVVDRRGRARRGRPAVRVDRAAGRCAAVRGGSTRVLMATMSPP